MSNSPKGDRFAFYTFVIGIITCIAAWLVVPEFRNILQIPTQIPNQTKSEDKETENNNIFNVNVAGIHTEINNNGINNGNTVIVNSNNNNNNNNVVFNNGDVEETECDVTITNESKYKITVAFYYYNGTNWLTVGWWIVNPGKSIKPNISSKLNYLYIFAYSNDGEWIVEKVSSLKREVIDESFSDFDRADSNLKGSNKRVVSFFRYDFDENGELDVTFQH